MKWVTSCLGEICRVGDGAHASLKREKDGIPYVTAKNLLGNRIDYSKMDYISTDTYKKYFKESSTALTRPQKDDILFSIIGSIGGLYLIKKDELFGLSSSVAIFRTKEETVFPKYLFYYMNSTMFDNKIQSVRSGVAQGFLSLSKLESIEIEYPQSIEYQKSIVNHLERFDELIDKNQNQIKLLEEAAQRLYKEWFIDLRFPGHETTPIINGIPEGWEVCSIESLGEYINGYAFKPSDWHIKGKPIIKIKELNDGITNNTPRNSGKDIPEKYSIKSGDIIFSWSATLTAVIWNSEEGLLNQHLFKVIPKNGIPKEFVLQSILHTLEVFRNLTTGATMKHIQRGKLKEVFVLLPSPKILKKYEVFSNAMREQIINLNNHKRLLAEARDRLLPKLMSGEIEV